MNKIFLATKNENKIKELNFILKDYDIFLENILHIKNIISLTETGTTLEENAYEKASTVFNFLGFPVLSDDTGLEVSCLKGKPGVYSARFAGSHASHKKNIQKVLRMLENIPAHKRQARFRTVICYLDNQNVKYFEGVCYGNITMKRVGEMGFGYDSIFCPIGDSRTFAEMDLKEKNKISHRYQAIQKFTQWYIDRRSELSKNAREI